MNERSRGLLAAALCGLALGVIVFRDALFGGGALFQRDLEVVYYGRVEVLRRCLAEGALPLWNPFAAFGEPLLALGVTHVLYPSAWLALVLPPPLAVAIAAAIHVGFTGLGSFLLARQLGRSTAAAAVAATAWACGDPLLSLVNMPNLFAGAAWLPWCALAASRVAAGAGRRLDVVALGASLAAPLLAGSPEAFLMCAAAALAIVPLGPADGTRKAFRLQPLALAALLGLGLAAVQWLPTLALRAHSARATLSQVAQAYWSQHPAGLLQVALPLPLDELPLSPGWRRALFEDREPFLHSLYLGVLAVPLLAGALGQRRLWPLAVLLASSLLLAFGRHAPGFDAIRGLPVLSLLRFPSKAMILAAFCVTLLAAFGFDALRAPAARRLRQAVAGLVAAIGVVALLLSSAQSPFWTGLLVEPAVFGRPWTDSPAFTATLRALQGAGILGLVAAVLVPWLDRRAVALAVASLAGLDALQGVRGLNPTASAAAFAWRTPALAPVPRERPNRVYAIDYSPAAAVQWLGRSAHRSLPFDAAPDAQLLLGRVYPVSELGAGAGGIEGVPLDIPRLRSAAVTRWLVTLDGALGQPLFARMLWLSGVAHLLSQHPPGPGFEAVAEARGVHEPVRLSRVVALLPRAFAVAGVRVAEGQQAFAALVSDGFDPLSEVVLAPAAGAAPAAAAPAGRIDELQLGLDRVALRVTLERPGYVVLLESWDPGWRAEVDGVAAEVLSANLVFRAVQVEAGRHRIEMRYRPLAVSVGAAISAVAALAAAGALAAGRFSRSRAASAPA